SSCHRYLTASTPSDKDGILRIQSVRARFLFSSKGMTCGQYVVSSFIPSPIVTALVLQPSLSLSHALGPLRALRFRLCRRFSALRPSIHRSQQPITKGSIILYIVACMYEKQRSLIT